MEAAWLLQPNDAFPLDRPAMAFLFYRIALVCVMYFAGDLFCHTLFELIFCLSGRRQAFLVVQWTLLGFVSPCTSRKVACQVRMLLVLLGSIGCSSAVQLGAVHTKRP